MQNRKLLLLSFVFCWVFYSKIEARAEVSFSSNIILMENAKVSLKTGDYETTIAQLCRILLTDPDYQIAQNLLTKLKYQDQVPALIKSSITTYEDLMRYNELLAERLNYFLQKRKQAALELEKNGFKRQDIDAVLSDLKIQLLEGRHRFQQKYNLGPFKEKDALPNLITQLTVRRDQLTFEISNLRDQFNQLKVMNRNMASSGHTQELIPHANANLSSPTTVRTKIPYDQELAELNGILNIYKAKLRESKESLSTQSLHITQLEEKLTLNQAELLEKDQVIAKIQDSMQRLEQKLLELQKEVDKFKNNQWQTKDFGDSVNVTDLHSQLERTRQFIEVEWKNLHSRMQSLSEDH